MLWCAARREGNVVLRNRAGGYLRANGRYLGWRKGVSVADDDGSAMMLWSLEVVPLGLRSLLIHPILHEQIDGDGKKEKVPQHMQQSIEENRGLDKQSRKQGLSELQPDCLFEVALKLPTRADILRLAATSRRLWTIIGSSDFKDAYYTTNGTSVAELIGVLNTREIQIMAISVGASVPISLNGLDNRFGIHVMDCHSGLLLLKDDFSGAMIIYDPTNGKSIPLRSPPVPQDCEFVAAGISPDESGKYSLVIALYARGSLFHYEQKRAWIATCKIHPRETEWTVYDNEIDFDLKEAEIKLPLVIASGELHLLNYNNFIISVCIKKPHTVRTQPLPFDRQMLTPSHILGVTG
ncbi:hypothetical protein PVAP13_1KG347000 [Panicum virgatum]|uniref:F-box domain-containing protein n=1 Tax=Panicum virgatum TaxID=38727 RepID=A0A8T0XK67_PANVG|nr:hypothetical protein PVAP13_1KG347000 [Panicum virgatum]